MSAKLVNQIHRASSFHPILYCNDYIQQARSNQRVSHQAADPHLYLFNPKFFPTVPQEQKKKQTDPVITDICFEKIIDQKDQCFVQDMNLQSLVTDQACQSQTIENQNLQMMNSLLSVIQEEQKSKSYKQKKSPRSSMRKLDSQQLSDFIEFKYSRQSVSGKSSRSKNLSIDSKQVPQAIPRQKELSLHSRAKPYF